MGEKRSVYFSKSMWGIIGQCHTGELSGRIARIADRYGLVCQTEQRALRNLFSPAELEAIADANRRIEWNPAVKISGGILANFEDSLQAGAFQNPTFNPKQLMEKLRALSIGQQVALVELLEVRKKGRRKA